MASKKCDFRSWSSWEKSKLSRKLRAVVVCLLILVVPLYDAAWLWSVDMWRNDAVTIIILLLLVYIPTQLLISIFEFACRMTKRITNVRAEYSTFVAFIWGYEMYLYGFWIFLQIVNEILLITQLYIIPTGWNIGAMTDKFNTVKIKVDLLHLPRNIITD